MSKHCFISPENVFPWSNTQNDMADWHQIPDPVALPSLYWGPWGVWTGNPWVFPMKKNRGVLWNCLSTSFNQFCPGFEFLWHAGFQDKFMSQFSSSSSFFGHSLSTPAKLITWGGNIPRSSFWNIPWYPHHQMVGDDNHKLDKNHYPHYAHRLNSHDIPIVFPLESHYTATQLICAIRIPI